MVNPGTLDLHVSSIDAGPNFGVVHGCSVVVGGASCPVEVLFAPEASGDPITGQLTVTSDAIGGPHQVSLSGRSTLVGLVAAPGGLIFPAVPVGETSPIQRLVLTASGDSGADIDRVDVIGTNPGDFQVVDDRCSGSWLSPNASCTVDVAFMPSAPGERSAELLVRTVDPLEFVVGMSGGRITIFRSGFEDGEIPWAGVVPAIAVTVAPKRLQFGPDDRFLRVTVANPTRHPTLIGRVRVSGGSPHAYRIVDDGCSNRRLEPGATCGVTVLAQSGSVRADNPVIEVQVADRLGRRPAEVPVSRSVGWPGGWR